VTNEVYLNLGYGLALVAVALLAIYVSISLGRTLDESLRSLLGIQTARNLRRMFVLSVGLLALAGFSAVSMTSCTVNTYEDVVTNRMRVRDRLEHKFSAGLDDVFVGLIVWSLVPALLIVGRSARRERDSTSTGKSRH